MILINLAGGPGSGKSTSASHLFAELKMEGVKAELVGEEAKEIIYDQLYPLLDNQVLITGRQWQRIQRLNKSGCEVGISDSPLIQGALYIQDKPYCAELTALLKKLDEQIPETYNVFVRRVKPYVKFGRYQDETQARELDGKILDLIQNWWMTIDGNRHGVHILTEAILKLVQKNREAEPETTIPIKYVSQETK
jgi:hypothetical protein